MTRGCWSTWRCGGAAGRGMWTTLGRVQAVGAVGTRSRRGKRARRQGAVGAGAWAPGVQPSGAVGAPQQGPSKQRNFSKQCCDLS